jgi:hypothetical protein
MYGTIMRGKLDPGARDAFLAAVSNDRVAIAGYRSSYLMFPESDEDEVCLVVFFDDRDSYMKNADDPAQHERYLAFRAHLTEDPTWTDGEWRPFEAD